MVSWVGAVALIRPHRQTPRRNAILAIIGLAAYAGVIAGYVYIHMIHDPLQSDPAYTIPGVVAPLRSLARLVMGACLIVAILGFRPNARLLAARSLVLRTGRVDRQPMYALAGAVGVAMLGDVGHLLLVLVSGVPLDVLWAASSLLIAVGSMG